MLIDSAKLRSRYAGPTVYVQNIGSSGSHWFKTMLGNALGLLASGEIYVAPKFKSEYLDVVSPKRQE